MGCAGLATTPEACTREVLCCVAAFAAPAVISKAAALAAITIVFMLASP
jgi:hypothetical protein